LSEIPEISEEARKELLRIARDAVRAASKGASAPELDLDGLPAPLAAHGASFVTLRHDDQLRGCIGSLAAKNPLALDVQMHAAAAAREDFRFAPIAPNEVDELELEVSVLSEPELLDCASPEDLLAHISPHQDGVILVCGHHRATFLPSVWESLSDHETFMQMLCDKANLPSDAWRSADAEVSTYQVMSFDDTESQE
jgi:AmmeMemoRadiSam system protein A